MITRWWIVSLVALAAGPTTAAWAQFDTGGRASGGVSVSGIGIVKGQADLAKIEVHVQGKAEITDDALVKYHASHRRMTEALEKLKLDNLKISEHAVTVSSGSGNNMQMMMNGMGNQSEAGSTEISGTLRVELKNLQSMPKEEVWKMIGKVLDAIRDAGGAGGSSPAEMRLARMYGMDMSEGTTVRFVMSDLKPLREQSYEMAVADARARAERLAKLNGIKLAGVAAVQEVSVAGDSAETVNNPYMFWGFNQSSSNDAERDQIEVESLREIPVMVRLNVRFDIAGQQPPAAPAAAAPSSEPSAVAGNTKR